ncbi:MAG: UbiH/UbiF family hydroxylase [Betaproteobacteria bacterium]|nr:UbiH/UbiF family hydroxylase [Betaproteobacteria bacterium]
MSRTFDIVIIGGGLVGLSLARALAGSGLSLALVEPQPPAPLPGDESWDSRIYAVSPGSATFLERGGAWQRLPQERVTRIEAMRVYGDDAAACLDFSAYDTGLRELAFIVESCRLQHALREAIAGQDARIHCPAAWSALEFHPDHAAVRLEDGSELAARLVIGADGAGSRVRAQAGIAVDESDYRQLGVVANFSCEKPHRGTAFQWFMRDGVLALLPLPGNRVSMVWSVAQERGRHLMALPDAELSAEVESASRGVVGALRVVTPAAGFPLRLQRVGQIAMPRLALVGDAAHNVHPLAGQGVNLGFRDARSLAGVLGERGPQGDCGDYALLRRYERARREDVLALQLVTDGLQKLFNNNGVWPARARNLGLRLVNRQPLLKNFLVNHAVA